MAPKLRDSAAGIAPSATLGSTLKAKATNLSVVDQARAWYFAYLIVFLLLLLVFCTFAQYFMLEPLSLAWSMLLAKLSDISASLSEQAAELSHLRSLILGNPTAGSGSGSTSADAASGTGLWAVGLRVLDTLGLLLKTSLTGLLGWVDWSCTLFKDIIGRVYTDPRGVLFNLLILSCLVATVGIAALACFVSSFFLQLLTSPSNNLPQHLWGWGFFFLGMLNPYAWFSSGGSNVVPEDHSASAPNVSDLAQLSDKLETTTSLIEDRLSGIQAALSAARLALPEEIRKGL